MKKIFLLLLTLLSITTFGQDGISGVSGYTNQGPTNGYLNSLVALSARTVHYNCVWQDIETSENTFNWTQLDADINSIVVTKGLYIGLQPQVGPNVPPYIYSYIDSIKTDDNVYTRYPDYFAAGYKSRMYRFLDSLISHLNSFPSIVKDKILYLHICEGSTGDTDPWKGVLLTGYDTPYNIAMDDTTNWHPFRRIVWDSCRNKINRIFPNLRMLINPGNDGWDLDYILENFPDAFIKAGNLSHDIGFLAEHAYFERKKIFQTKSENQFRVRGEVQGVWLNPWWSANPLRMSYVLTMSFKAGGGDYFNTPNGFFTGSTTDPRIFDIITKYDERDPIKSNKGFIGLRDLIDFADSVRFPIGTYGEVVVNKTSYWNQLLNFSGLNKLYQMETKTRNTIAGSRVTAIISATSGWGADYSDETNNYLYDYGFCVAKNYEYNIVQVNSYQTSHGVYRIGADTGMHGRFARTPILTNGSGEMIFNVVDSLRSNIGAINPATITVTYYDTTNAIWSINYSTIRGITNALTIQNNNTRLWKTVTATVPNFFFENRISGGDLTIKQNTPGVTIFELVEFNNTGKPGG